MNVFKFGGASVKDAAGVKNLASIVAMFPDDPLVIVVSAMGKTTNALEAVVAAHMRPDGDPKAALDTVKQLHAGVLEELGCSDDPVSSAIANVFVEIEWALEEPPREYAFVYDQVVSQGELISSLIVSAYLRKAGLDNAWADIRDCLITDNNYREGNVLWDLTGRLTREKLLPLLERRRRVVTQGFIGATSENFTTTLGREGSDYTAAILSHCLDAAEMTVWKDVPGVLSADPKYSDDAVKLEQISYHDAIELTYYGATVIHPKTIKPLENKNIPLRVRSFQSPGEKGTRIGNFHGTKPLVPSFIFKTNQILLSISSKDFSFIAEEHLSDIFRLLAKHRVKMNLMQNSALSFSVCLDNDPYKIPSLLDDLQEQFKVLYNEPLRLVTVRHYYPSTLDRLVKGKTLLLEQRSRQTAQLVLKEEGVS